MAHLVLGSGYNHSSVMDGYHRNRKTMPAHLVNASASISTDWLKSAALAMNISDNLEDFVLNDIGIVVGDLPNRKMQAFPMDELLRYDAVWLGNPVYMSFKGKPTFLEHKNDDVTKAKGIILDTRMIYIPAYDVFKVHCLCGWDKTKDRNLAQAIARDEMKTFSMGAWVDEFICSICKKVDPYELCDDDGNPLPRCSHMMNIGNVYNGKLAYQESRGAIFFELSAVTTPAEVSAFGELL